MPIPAEATRVSGITDAMVEFEPHLAEVWGEITAFVDTHTSGCLAGVVVAHNAPFDRGVIAVDLARSGTRPERLPRWRWLDSVPLARRVLPGRSTYSLQNNAKGTGLACALRVQAGKAHRALGDVETLCAILVEMRRLVGKPFREWCGETTVWGPKPVSAAAPASKPATTPTPKPAAPRKAPRKSPDMSLPLPLFAASGDRP